MSRHTMPPAVSPDGYEQVYHNEPFRQPAGHRWDLACCHCGLVHTVRLRPIGDEVEVTMGENAAATKRHRKVPGQSPELDAAWEEGFRLGQQAAYRHLSTLEYRKKPARRRK